MHEKGTRLFSPSKTRCLCRLFWTLYLIQILKGLCVYQNNKVVAVQYMLLEPRNQIMYMARPTLQKGIGGKNDLPRRFCFHAGKLPLGESIKDFEDI